MRQTAARLNRAWLTILGVVLLPTGMLGLAIGTGVLAWLGTTTGVRLDRPGPSNHLFGAASTATLGLTWVVLLVAIGGIVLGLLGLAWLLAQIPRTNEAKPFRLHDDAQTGLTKVAPGVLTDAVKAQVEALPGVQSASAVLRGSAAQPDLIIRVTASDRTDITRLLHTLENRVAMDLGNSLDTRLRRLGVQIEIDTTKTRTDHITL